MEIRVNISEIQSADRALRIGVHGITDRARHREVMGSAGDLLRDIAQNRIESKKYDPDGRPWRPWSPTYQAPKHGGHTLLKLSGDMQRRIRRTRGVRKMEVGTTAVYGNVHQHGHTFTNAFGRGIKAHVPARPIFGWGPDERDGVDSEFQTFLEGAFRWW
jgi:phage virion morphogenesis protein